ncbi:hypothetical protein D9M72_386450 [compost metagenome]
MELGGDAVCQQLAVHVEQRTRVWETDARARHDRALESVAMDIDDARQYQQVARVEP